MKPSALSRFESELEILEQNSLMRKFPQTDSKIISLSHNSYLNLHQNEQINERALELCGGNLFGALASRLVKQNTPLFEQLEETICRWKNFKNALVFNTGFSANLGVIQALSGKNTAIFSDKLNHASIIDGIRLSEAKFFRYNHNDYRHLGQLLKTDNSKEKFIISDVIFSMDGDIADVAQLIGLADRYDAFLLLDEAHSLKATDEVKGDNLLTLGTLSKAVAGMGGYLSCNATVKNYLINKCRPLIFSTALPQSVLAWNIAAIEYLIENPSLGDILLNKAEKFRQKLKAIGVNVGQSESQIIPIITGSNESALNLSQKFREAGLIIPAIRPPTVPTNTARCRISLNLGITDDVLDKILSILNENREEKRV